MKLNQIFDTNSQSIVESKHFFDAEIKLHVNITLSIWWTHLVTIWCRNLINMAAWVMKILWRGIELVRYVSIHYCRRVLYKAVVAKCGSRMRWTAHVFWKLSAISNYVRELFLGNTKWIWNLMFIIINSIFCSTKNTKNSIYTFYNPAHLILLQCAATGLAGCLSIKHLDL